MRFFVLILVILAAGRSIAAAYETELPKTQKIAALKDDLEFTNVAANALKVLQFPARDHAESEVPATYRFLVQGGLHGNEELGSGFVLWLARRYAQKRSLLNLLPRDLVAIDFLPYANPDGTQNRTRYNARGVNLNRNFGVLWGLTKENPGKTSFSEPETRAIKQLFETQKYTGAVDVHGYVNWIVSPSAPQAVAARGLMPSKSQRLAYSHWVQALKTEMAILPNYQLQNGAQLGDGGAFEDWAFWSQDSFAFCLELESLQRYSRSYRHDSNDLSKEPESRGVDLFKRYEAFVYRMFAHAIRLKQWTKPPSEALARAP